MKHETISSVANFSTQNRRCQMSQEQSEHKTSRLSRRRIMMIVVAMVAVILLIPFVFKGEARAALVGPTLSEIEYTEVSFQNGDLQLSGMLILPEGEGPFPAAVIIRGSGTSSRDHKWYLIVASHLQDNGIAVLLPDKRGSEESEGDWRGASFDDLAGDTLSAISYIKNQDRFEYSTIGVIGMSQGGWIAPLVATKSDDVSFVVSMSGAGVTTDEQLLFEEINSITDMGTYPFVARLIAPLTTKNIQRMDFWRPIAGFDPLPYWEQVEARSFAAFGGDDKNVPVEESITRLQALEKEMLIKVYHPNGGHGITNPDTGEMLSTYLSDLVDFIKK